MRLKVESCQQGMTAGSFYHKSKRLNQMTQPLTFNLEIPPISVFSFLTILLKSANQVISNHLCRTTLYLVTFNDVNQFSVFK